MITPWNCGGAGFGAKIEQLKLREIEERPIEPIEEQPESTGKKVVAMCDSEYVVHALSGKNPEIHTARFNTLVEARSYALELWAAGYGARISWVEVTPIMEYDSE